MPRKFSTGAMPSDSYICREHGCQVRVHSGSASFATGFCAGHAEGALPRRQIAERDDIRVAHVPYPTGNSGIASVLKVSLPREPWAKGGVA